MEDSELETLRRVLQETGWEPEPGSTPKSFFVDFGPPHVPVSSALAAVSDSQQFIFYVIFGVSAADDRCDEVARYITRANCGLMIGNFEMDFTDGLIRFKSSVDFSGGELSEVLIKNAILAAMNAVDAYADGLINVLAGRMDALKAIEAAEL